MSKWLDGERQNLDAIAIAPDLTIVTTIAGAKATAAAIESM